MYISALQLRNYRNFRCSKLLFHKGINTLIGENGSGKTNLFYALRLLIDDTLPRYTKFYESDFNRALGQWEGHWISIALEFEELDNSDEIRLLAVQSAGHMDTVSKGSYSLYFRPKFSIRKKLFEYSADPSKTTAGLRSILDEITIDDYETTFRCRGTGDFSDEAVYITHVGDFENIIFPNPEDENQQVIGVWLPREVNILNEISCTFIKALRDVESDLKSYGNNPLVNLLRGREKTVSVAKATDITTRIDELNEKISGLAEVRDITKGIDESIHEAVGSTYAPNVDIKSELPNEMDKLFQSLKLWVGDPDEDGYKGRIWELSLGGANLIYLSLKLLEYEKVKTDRAANFLLIEEPEAHIHTHIQKTLFSNLNKNRTQVIISTHSTHISSVSKISSVNILCRASKQAQVFQPSKNLSQDHITRIERYLDAVRSTLLFAKGVLLVEGDAEQILIPEMFKSVFGVSLDEIGISLVNIGSTGFKNIARLFHQDRIQRNCAIITDQDTSVLPLEDELFGDTPEEKACRASEKKGLERKADLEKFIKDNDHINLFFADYTFEVDFLKNGNQYEIKACISSVYNNAKKVDEMTKSVDDSSVAVFGPAVLEMANYKGKGWFALLLAEHLNYNTYVPKYILQAIAYSSAHINDQALSAMAIYRLNKIIKNTSEDQTFRDRAAELKKDYRAKVKAIEPMKGFLDNYKAEFKNDQLTVFLNLL